MTDYLTTDPFVKKMQGYLSNIKFWKSRVIDALGTIELDNVFNSQKYIEFEKLWALGASIKISDDGSYGSAPEWDFDGLHIKLKWATGILGLDENDMEDLQAGSKLISQGMKESRQSIAFKFNRTIEEWTVGYGTTFTSKKDYDKRWIPCFAASSAGTIEDPSDINDLVTNRAGSPGSSGTAFAMATKLTSTSTNQTINFIDQTFGPFLEAFANFEDTDQGNRMVDEEIAEKGTDIYTVIMNPLAIRAYKNTKVYNGEYYTDKTMYQEARDYGIKFLPSKKLTAALAEEAGGGEGTIQFIVVADIKKNFKKAKPKKMIWLPWFKKWMEKANKLKWIKRVKQRWTVFRMPYRDDDETFYKAMGHGTHYYMNDTA